MPYKYNYSRKLCISTNSTCNLNCIYCYEREKEYLEFDESEAIVIIDRILNEATEKGTKIKLHGGEPFLVFRKIRHLCETIWAKNYPEKYRFHITTNGTLIHGEIQDWLFKNRDKIVIKLSLDGNRESSEINRPHSFDQIDFAFFVKTWPNLRVNMTVSPQTLPFMYENVKYIHSLGIKDIISHFALRTDWSGCSLEKTMYQQLIQISDYYLDHPDIQPWHLFGQDIGRTLYTKKRCVSSCNIGQELAYDFQTRQYYPCYMCFPSMAGEETSKELLDIDFTNPDNIEEEVCLKCPFLNICSTCYAENYISRGAISRRDMSLCKYLKIIFAVLFQFEYRRILQLKEPSSSDKKKMMAIYKWQGTIDEIIRTILHQ